MRKRYLLTLGLLRDCFVFFSFLPSLQPSLYFSSLSFSSLIFSFIHFFNDYTNYSYCLKASHTCFYKHRNPLAIWNWRRNICFRESLPSLFVGELKYLKSGGKIPIVLLPKQSLDFHQVFKVIFNFSWAGWLINDYLKGHRWTKTVRKGESGLWVCVSPQLTWPWECGWEIWWVICSVANEIAH